MTKVVINPEFGTKEIAVSIGVRMLKNPTLTMADILAITDNEILRTVEVEDVETEAEVVLA